MLCYICSRLQDCVARTDEAVQRPAPTAVPNNLLPAGGPSVSQNVFRVRENPAKVGSLGCWKTAKFCSKVTMSKFVFLNIFY